MTRQKRTLIVVAVALVAATVASYGVYAAIARIPVRTVEVATTFTVVAARSLALGAQLQAADLKLAAWPARTPIAGGFSSVADVVGRGLLSSVAENEPIVSGKVATREAGAGLPPSIPPGMRAISVKVNEVIGVAGFVVPGTRVDVLVVIRQRDDSIARVVVSNAQVLTAGTRYDQENVQREAKAIPSTVVTLLVSPPDAERVALAQSEGQIQLSLRNPLDLDATESTGVRTAGLVSWSSPAAPVGATAVPVRRRVAPVQAVPAGAAAPAGPALYLVETIRGTKRAQEGPR